MSGRTDQAIAALLKGLAEGNKAADDAARARWYKSREIPSPKKTTQAPRVAERPSWRPLPPPGTVVDKARLLRDAEREASEETVAEKLARARAEKDAAITAATRRQFNKLMKDRRAAERKVRR